jgi:hypothetical protein
MLLSLLKETYDIHLSSITIILQYYIRPFLALLVMRSELTFRDLQKLVQQSQSGSEQQQSQLPQRLKNKPFWIWNLTQHKERDRTNKGNGCFWHIIGLPQKDGHDMPLLPCQRTLYYSLQNHSHIWHYNLLLVPLAFWTLSC